jgi:hypothetical protein
MLLWLAWWRAHQRKAQPRVEGEPQQKPMQVRQRQLQVKQHSLQDYCYLQDCRWTLRDLQRVKA